MNILLCCNLTNLSSSIVKKLNPEGYNIIPFENLQQLKNSLNLLGNVLIIDDITTDKKEIISFIKDLRKHEQYQNTKSIILTNILDLNFAQAYFKIGFDYVISIKSEIETISEKINVFLQKNVANHEQRKFVRIKTHDDESALIKLINKKDNLVCDGKIKDISLGGLAAQFSETLDEYAQNECTHAQIILDNRSIFIDMKLVKNDSQTSAFAFSNLKENQKENICEFIFKHLHQI